MFVLNVPKERNITPITLSFDNIRVEEYCYNHIAGMDYQASVETRNDNLIDALGFISVCTSAFDWCEYILVETSRAYYEICLTIKGFVLDLYVAAKVKIVRVISALLTLRRKIFLTTLMLRL